MSEFGNRIAAQRTILKTVNANNLYMENLLGLSDKAIKRWISANLLNPMDALPKLIYLAGEKLFFLANKSQEQVTEDYKILSSEISSIHALIETELKIKSI